MAGLLRTIHRIGVVLLLSSLLHCSLAVNEDEVGIVLMLASLHVL